MHDAAGVGGWLQNSQVPVGEDGADEGSGRSLLEVYGFFESKQLILQQQTVAVEGFVVDVGSRD